MIAYRDFKLKTGGERFFGLRKANPGMTLDGAVEQANAWIAAEEVRVITVETIIIGQYGISRACRVWYEGSASEQKKATEPEI